MRPRRRPGQRIGSHPALPVTAPEEVTFEFEGKRLVGQRGEAISSALLANGYSLLSRSIKYHRPRGLTCFAAACPNCAMTINGIPGTLACASALEGGEIIRRERGWPTADFDLLESLDRLSRMAPAGFQYRWFAHSPRLSRLMGNVVSAVAGGGRMPASGAAQRSRTGLLGTHDADLAVIGGGAAGMAAALAAAGEGANVTLVERRGELGGTLSQETRLLEHQALPVTRAVILAQELADLIHAHPRISVFMSSSALGWYEGNIIPIATRGGVIALTARRLVVACGTYEEPVVFPDSDRPGIMFASAAQRLVNIDRVLPGRHAVVITSESYGHFVAAQLTAAGMDVRAIVDSRDEAAANADSQRADLTVPIHAECYPVRAHGRRRVTALTFSSTVTPRWSERVPCDTIILAGGRRPADELALQIAYEGSMLLEPSGFPGAGGALEGDHRLGTLEAVWLAGGSGGVRTLEDALVDGSWVGQAATRTT